MGMPLDKSDLPGEKSLPYYALYEPTSKGTKHTVWFNGLQQVGSFSIENQNMLSQILIDQAGHYWFVEQEEKSKETTNLYVFDSNGVFLKNLLVSGRPNLFEFGESVFAGCEGNDEKSRIYEFSKNNLCLVRQWTVEGFLWGLEKVNDRLYVSSYLPDKDAAMLYVFDNNGFTEVHLGDQFFPTDLLYFDGALYVAACPIFDSGEKKIIRLNDDHTIAEEYPLAISPRQLYTFGCELVIHALELASDKQEKLIYFDFTTGEQKEYVIPHAHTIKGIQDRLFLVNLEAQSVIQWDHRKRKITKVNRLPKNESQHVVDFHCYQ